MNLGHILPELLVLVLACSIVLLDAVWRRREAAASLAYPAAFGLLAPALALVPLIGRNETSYFGTFVVDPIALFFKLLFLLAAGMTFLLSVGYVRRHGLDAGEYYATILFATFGFMFMASARDLITAYIALEMASISLYILVGFHKTDLRSSEAGLKYLLLGALSSAALLYGMVLLYGATGTTLLPDIGARLTGGGVLAIVAIALVTAGLGFKIAAVPFHMWVPDVYEGAPTPTTAFLSVASKTAGFALALRVFGQGLLPLEELWAPLMGVLAALTMTIGNVGALRQSNVKRLLGYSSIGQAGYVMMALAAPSAEALSGMLYFLLAYVLTNLGAFAGIVAIGNQIGSDEIADYRGLARRNGGLAFFTTLCFLSLVGMPPMAGFVSKFYLFLTVFQRGLVWLVIVAVLNTAIAAYYYVKVIRAMYFAEPVVDTPIGGGGAASVALWAATLATIAVGLAAWPFIQIAELAGQAFFR
jgi:NADH-quinone oxidoreductase subunit N